MPYELRQGARTLRVLDDEDDLLPEVHRAILAEGLPAEPDGERVA